MNTLEKRISKFERVPTSTRMQKNNLHKSIGHTEVSIGKWRRSAGIPEC